MPYGRKRVGEGFRGGQAGMGRSTLLVLDDVEAGERHADPARRLDVVAGLVRPAGFVEAGKGHGDLDCATGRFAYSGRLSERYVDAPVP